MNVCVCVCVLTLAQRPTAQAAEDRLKALHQMLLSAGAWCEITCSRVTSCARCAARADQRAVSDARAQRLSLTLHARRLPAARHAPRCDAAAHALH
jgi:hypothetical protein